jgi:hypothetical protein
MGVQHGDLGHPQPYYAAAGGNLDASDHTSGATVDHRTSARYRTPRATASPSGGTTTRYAGRHQKRSHAAMG